MTDTVTHLTDTRSSLALEPLRSALLSQIDGVVHGLTYRIEGLGAADGNIGLGSPRDKQDAWEMRQLWCRAIGVNPESIVTMGQLHGTKILRSTADDAGKGAKDGRPPLDYGDGLITDDPGVTLLTLHADCQPILLVDPDRPAVGAIHAGWRGTVANIAGAAVLAMQTTFDSPPESLLAYLGPAIGACCNEIGPEVTAQWRETARSAGVDPEVAVTRPVEREHLNVPEANRQMLLAAGLDPAHIDVDPECTRCDTDRWFSHRGHGPNAGREGAFIAIQQAS